MRGLKSGERTAQAFMNWVNDTLIPSLSSGQTAMRTISPSTAVCWLHALIWEFGRDQKDLYFDGHEREDVVKYRNEIFIPKMLSLENRVASWTGENLETIVPPKDIDAGECVIFAHDECCYHANDGTGYYWRPKGEPDLRKKGRGAAYMVSEFLCACHGNCDSTMVPPDTSSVPRPEMFYDASFSSKLPAHWPNCENYRNNLAFHTCTEWCEKNFDKPDSAFEYFQPGKNHEGYWGGEDVVQHLRRVAPMLQKIHPGKQLVFVFDNSSTHDCKACDGLDANALNLKPVRDRVVATADRVAPSTTASAAASAAAAAPAKKAAKNAAVRMGNGW